MKKIDFKDIRVGLVVRAGHWTDIKLGEVVRVEGNKAMVAPIRGGKVCRGHSFIVPFRKDYIFLDGRSNG